jgi:hypothetical protein
MQAATILNLEDNFNMATPAPFSKCWQGNYSELPPKSPMKAGLCETTD